MDAEPVKRFGKKKKPLATSKSRGLRVAFCRSGERRFSGIVVDCDNLSRKFVVEILIDGYPVQVIRADALDHELLKEKVGDGCYGFFYSLKDSAINDGAVVEARIANVGTPVGTPIVLDRQSADASPQPDFGTIRWLGGLRFSGWIAGRQEVATANVLVDGTSITRVRASTWSHVRTSKEEPRAVRTFDFYLPEQFADGIVHQLVVTSDAGENINGNSLAFIAYPDGLQDAVAGRGISEQDVLRAKLLDRLLPMSVPFSNYQNWRERISVPLGPSASLRAAVIMVGSGAADDTLESLQGQSYTDWSAASLPETSGPTGFQVGQAQAFLADKDTNYDFVVFTLAGTLFTPFAIQQIADAFEKNENAQAVYCDLDLASGDGSTWPLAFSAFDYERTLEQGYCAHLFALRRHRAERSLEAGASNLYRLFISILDDRSVPHSDIVHVPEALGTLPEFDRAAAGAELAAAGHAHFQRRGIRSKVTPNAGSVLPAARIARAFRRPRTTIVIPTRNRRELLEGCLESLQPAIKRTDSKILVVDNDTTDPDTLRYLARIKKRRVTVLRVPGEFNFPRLNNCAAKAADGEFLCFLNNDIKALDDHWLEEMLSRITDQDVGAVGALLVWPTGVVQHGGVVLGPSFAATHAFNDRIDGDGGYSDLLRVAHECSAVTAACMVTRRDDFLKVGGMDEVHFPVNFNDVDYCLKLRALGKRIVFTPHAKLLHLESASRGADLKANDKDRAERELMNLRAKWGEVLAADPYYSPKLSLDPIPYSALAWPLRTMEPRINIPPTCVQIPEGF